MSNYLFINNTFIRYSVKGHLANTLFCKYNESPSKHVTLEQRHIYVNATPLRCIDVDTTLFNVMSPLGIYLY